MSTEQQFTWFKERFDELVDGVETVIKGKVEQVQLAMTCFIAEGHLLIEDRPGTGKTALARTLAALSDSTWSRIQFTPDLLPSDVTGVTIYNQRTQGFEFHQGPVFANIVVADEINRASPKTQSALLEVMEERQVTVDATAYKVPRPFIVIATQNSIEFDGTYKLPEAQLDRFMMCIELGYPAFEHELSIIESGGANVTVPLLETILATSMIQAMQTLVDHVEVVPEVRRYVVRLAHSTRSHPELRLPVSTRGVMSLVRASRALAAADGRHFVRPEDVKALVGPVWAHRMLVTSEAEFNGRTARAVLAEIVDETPVKEPMTR